MSKSYNWLIGNDQQSINATRVVDRKPWFKSVGIKKPFQTGFSLFEYISHLDGYIYQWCILRFYLLGSYSLVESIWTVFWLNPIHLRYETVDKFRYERNWNKQDRSCFQSFRWWWLMKKIGIGTLTGRKWIADNLCFIIEINDKHLTVLLLNFWNTN